MHWKIALCSLSIGISSVPARLHLVHEQPARHHQRLLVGEQHALAGARRGERRQQARPRRRWPPSPSARWRRRPPRPAPRRRSRPASATRGLRSAARACARPRPDRPGPTVSGWNLQRLLDHRSASCRRRRAPPPEIAPDAARSRRSVLRPMLPVEPRIAMPHRRAHAITPEPNRPSAYKRRRRRHAVDAVQHAAVPGQQRAAVLEPGRALEHALRQIADHREDAHRAAERRRTAAPASQNAPRAAQATSATAAQPADRALPGLAGAHARREFAPPEAPVRRRRRRCRRRSRAAAATARAAGRGRTPSTRDREPRKRHEGGHQHRHAAQQREARGWRVGRQHQPQEGRRPTRRRRSTSSITSMLRIAGQAASRAAAAARSRRHKPSRAGRASEAAEARPFPCRRCGQRAERQHHRPAAAARTGPASSRPVNAAAVRIRSLSIGFQRRSAPRSCRSGARAGRRTRMPHRDAPP